MLERLEEARREKGGEGRRPETRRAKRRRSSTGKERGEEARLERRGAVFRT